MLDSKVVNRAIKAEIWSVLKESGFDRFTAKTAWRFQPGQIDIINFQSFNAYNALVIGCTSFSFVVNLGSYSLAIPDDYPIPTKLGLPEPKEYHCHFRGRLKPSVSQPKLGQDDIWYIDAGGENLIEAISDVRRQLLSGDEWFSRFQQMSEVIRILSEDNETDALWGFGRNPSPSRHYKLGYCLLSEGKRADAAKHLRAALASNCYNHVSDRLRHDIEQASGGI